MSIGKNIASFRKAKGWTQAELGEKIGVSNQSVSKWESETSMPDIMLLPALADAFGCHIDELFSREVQTEIHYDYCVEFPWPDDSVIRGVVCEGRKILQYDSIVDRFTFEVKGDAKNVKTYCNIEVHGNVSGGCAAGENINISGAVSGGCSSGSDTVIGGCLSGGCSSGGDITVAGSFSGGSNAGGSITCGGNFSGDIVCGGYVTVKGDVEAERIQGNVVCNSLNCDKVEGYVTIKKAD